MEKEPTPSYTVREASPADVEAIRTMQAQSWRDTYENQEAGVTKDWLEEETSRWFTDEAMARSQERLGRYFDDPTQLYRVAVLGGEVVGLLHVDTKEDGTKHLWGLYTAQRTHGTGLAQQLMEIADAWIDGDEVDLEVATYNERAKAFYRKAGFVDAEQIDELFKGVIPTMRMVRKGDSDEV